MLNTSPATDQETYVVARAYSDKNGIASVGNFAKAPATVALGGPAEGQICPNGPTGLHDAQRLDVDCTVIEEGGGPVTVDALENGAVPR